MEKIIELLENNPQMSQRELAELTGLTQRGIEWNIIKLKKAGLLERIGPDKGGNWEVSEESVKGDPPSQCLRRDKRVKGELKKAR